MNGYGLLKVKRLREQENIVFLPFNFVFMQVGTKINKSVTKTNKVSRILRGTWWKELLMTFIATTFSIVLTFGTAALIDKKQKEKNKRQMAMYVLYDMNRSIELIEQSDSLLRRGLELQIEVARDTSLFETKKFFFNHYMPSESFDKTTAQIFSSNFETLNILDNMHIVEMISDFYHDRKAYEIHIIDSCKNDYLLKAQHWDLETALEFPFSYYILMSGVIGENMKEDFQRCKELMGISDKEFAAFVLQKQSQTVPKASADDKTDKHMNEMLENESRLEAAIEEGKSGKVQSE